MILNDWRLTGKTSSRFFFFKGKRKEDQTKQTNTWNYSLAREGRRKRNLFCFWIVFIPVSFFKILLVFMLFSFKINHIGNDSYSEYYHANYSYLEYSRANYSYLEYSYEYIGTHAKKHNSCTFFSFLWCVLVSCLFKLFPPYVYKFFLFPSFFDSMQYWSHLWCRLMTWCDVDWWLESILLFSCMRVFQHRNMPFGTTTYITVLTAIFKACDSFQECLSQYYL